MKRLHDDAGWQSLPEPELRRRQLAKLRSYLARTVVPFSAHYREVFAKARVEPSAIREWGDLRRIPFTTKADLLASPGHPQRSREFILTPERRALITRPSTLANALLHGRAAVERRFEHEFRPALMTATTGRSSEPVAFVYSKHDIDVLAVAGYRVQRVCGAEREWKMVNMFPFAPHLAFWFAHYSGTEFGVFMLSTGGGKVMGTEGNLRAIAKLDPEALIGMPTFIYHVMQQAREEGIRCRKLRKIVLGGEKCPGGMRRKMRSLARELGSGNVDVLTTYAFTEAKMAWAECPHPHDAESGGYHLYPDLGIMEIVDPTSGEPVPDGAPGEIVFTPLEARGSVVLRYRTGDVTDGGITHEPCPHCGRRVPRLLGRIARTSEVKEMNLDKLKGTLVDFNQLEHVLDDSENVGAWQIELRKANDDPLELDEVILHVQKAREVGDEQLREELRERFAAETEIRPNEIVFETLADMRRLQGVGVQLKEQRIVDHRPKGEPA